MSWHSFWNNFWDKQEKSKLWSWMTLGANKVATAFHAASHRQYRQYLDRKSIEEHARNLGFNDLEEFFAVYPEERDKYESADGKIHVDTSSGDSKWLVDTAKAAVDNFTGQRDVIENEKNRDFQSDQAEIAREWEAEQARIAREWDSIGARMERAAAAGVNPISIAMSEGGFGTSGTSSVPTSPGVPMGSSGLMHNGALDIASTVFQGIGTLAEQRLKQSQADDIVIMRNYNIAEKIATTDHLRQMDSDIELSKVAQTIQNQWLDRLNQATFDSMYNEMGYRDAMSEQARSVVKLNLSQIDSIKQDMSLNLQRFNATLPLELQLMESELNLKNASVQQIYTEICMRHLQAIEQQSRNVQAAAEAESAQTASDLAKATYEDAISAFHNDMVRGAAEAGISLYDYQYYGTSFTTLPGYVSKAVGKLKFGDAIPEGTRGNNHVNLIKGLGR